MELLITPFVGIGPLKLGINRGDLHNNISGEVMTRPAEPASGYFPKFPLTDYFSDYSAKVEYGRNNQTIFIEVGPICPLLFHGQDLFKLSYGELITFFKKTDPELIMVDAGFTSMKYNIAVYAPAGVNDPSLPCELISVFMNGYYEEELY
jgi:hypothetical protein